MQTNALLRELESANFASKDISVLFLEAGAGTRDRPSLEGEWQFQEFDQKPDPGSILVAGPMTKAMKGRNAGGIAERLAAYGIPEKEAAIYVRALERGGILVAAHTANPEMAEQACRSFRMSGSEGVISMMVVSNSNNLHRGIGC